MKLLRILSMFGLFFAVTTAAQAGNRYYSMYAPAPVTAYYAPAPITSYYAPAYAAPVMPAAVVVRRPLLRPFAPAAYFGVAAPVAAPVAVAPQVILPAPVAPVSYASPSYSGPVSNYYRGPIAAPVTSYYPPVNSVYRPIYPAYGPVGYTRW